MDSVEINGERFAVDCVFTKNKNATARLREKTIVIGLPSRWPGREKDRVGADLLKRAIRAIEKGRWKPGRERKARFFHGQRLKALGKEFELVFVSGKRFGGRTRDGRIEVRAPEHQNDRISRIVRREIVKSVMPELRERVERINSEHFASSVRRISVRDTLSRWGSCSPNGDISLCFRLLFMPEGILDYVIVHELAHTRYRGHGPRFWSLVERVVPDYREKRKWLRENGSAVLADEAEKGQGKITDFFEEPY